MNSHDHKLCDQQWGQASKVSHIPTCDKICDKSRDQVYFGYAKTPLINKWQTVGTVNRSTNHHITRSYQLILTYQHLIFPLPSSLILFQRQSPLYSYLDSITIDQPFFFFHYYVSQSAESYVALYVYTGGCCIIYKGVGFISGCYLPHGIFSHLIVMHALAESTGTSVSAPQGLLCLSINISHIRSYGCTLIGDLLDILQLEQIDVHLYQTCMCCSIIG